MIGHLGLSVGDLAATKRYFDRFVALLGFEEFLNDDDQFAYRPAGAKPGTYLFFYPVSAGEGLAEGFVHGAAGLQHLAFMVPTRAAVHEVAALAASLGSPIVHEPQVFEAYPQPYFATFWRDPNGFLLEAVCHRDA